MNSYKILRFYYPGIINIKTNAWIPFNINGEKFAFIISGHKKGLVVFDPDNEILKSHKFSLRREINEINNKNIAIVPYTKDNDLGYYNVTESDPNSGRCFYNQSYTEVVLLIKNLNKKISIDTVNYYLNCLFVKYNTSYSRSTLQIPNKSYWEESIKVVQAHL